MKRALVIGTGTVMGVAAVLALNPDGGAAASGNLPTIPSSTSTGSSSTSNASSASNSGSASNSANTPSSNAATTPNSSSNTGSSSNTPSTASKTTQGSAVDVGYGIVQVEAVIKGGKLVDVQAVSLPNSDGHSARISKQAFPMLVKQAISAQSANISGIGGASYTSYGFQQSLSAALTDAGFKG